MLIYFISNNFQWKETILMAISCSKCLCDCGLTYRYGQQDASLQLFLLESNLHLLRGKLHPLIIREAVLLTDQLIKFFCIFVTLFHHCHCFLVTKAFHSLFCLVDGTFTLVLQPLILKECPSTFGLIFEGNIEIQK